MPNPTFKRWTADEIAKLKNLAQKKTLEGHCRRTGSLGFLYGRKSSPSRGVAKTAG